MQAATNFTETEEIAKFISEKNVKILNLCHVPEDGRLKTLSFAAANHKRIYEILELGERVDGSSLFSFIEPGKSDIYIMPRLDRVFTNPFSTTPTLNIMCDYLGEDGKLLHVAPRNVLMRAEEKLHSSTGVVLKALAELEFYIISKPNTDVIFPNVADRNYHESAPFARFEDLRNEILVTLSGVGIATKYGHSEVGRILGKDGTLMEQQEVEFVPQKLTDLAETIAIAKWVIRNTCARHGVSVSFSPKMTMEHAGTGMHIHLCALKNGRNILVGSDGTLSHDAKKMIGGILKFAPSLSAFGNPTPVSYLRFIARKESPMHICWSARNRLALVRIPLWWSFKKLNETQNCRETFEYRAPDAFANAHLLLAGIALAADYGLRNSEEALQIAEKLHLEENHTQAKKAKMLPRSCSESAANLQRDRRLYEAEGVFPKQLIDKTVELLRSYRDKGMWKRLATKPVETENFLKQYLYQG